MKYGDGWDMARRLIDEMINRPARERRDQAFARAFANLLSAGVPCDDARIEPYLRLLRMAAPR